MATSYKTVVKMYDILVEELPPSKIKKLISRLQKETVPSGNKSYDTTIQRLKEYMEGRI